MHRFSVFCPNLVALGGRAVLHIWSVLMVTAVAVGRRGWPTYLPSRIGAEQCGSPVANLSRRIQHHVFTRTYYAFDTRADALF